MCNINEFTYNSRKKKIDHCLTKFRKIFLFSSKKFSNRRQEAQQSVFTNTIYSSVSDASLPKRDRYEYKEEFSGAGRRRKIRSRTSTRTSLGVHIVTNDYFPSSGIQTAPLAVPSSPFTRADTFAGVAWIRPRNETLPQCLENVSRTYAILPPPPRVVVRSLVPPPSLRSPFSVSLVRYRAPRLARSRSALRVLILIRSVRKPRFSVERSARKRGAGCVVPTAPASWRKRDIMRLVPHPNDDQRAVKRASAAMTF